MSNEFKQVSPLRWERADGVAIEELGFEEGMYYVSSDGQKLFLPNERLARRGRRVYWPSVPTWEDGPALTSSESTRASQDLESAFEFMHGGGFYAFARNL